MQAVQLFQFMQVQLDLTMAKQVYLPTHFFHPLYASLNSIRTTQCMCDLSHWPLPLSR